MELYLVLDPEMFQKQMVFLVTRQGPVERRVLCVRHILWFSHLEGFAVHLGQTHARLVSKMA